MSEAIILAYWCTRSTWWSSSGKLSSLFVKERVPAIWEDFCVKPLLLHTEGSRLMGFNHLVPPQVLPFQCSSMTKLEETLEQSRRDYISELPWECQKELGGHHCGKIRLGCSAWSVATITLTWICDWKLDGWTNTILVGWHCSKVPASFFFMTGVNTNLQYFQALH